MKPKKSVRAAALLAAASAVVLFLSAGASPAQAQAQTAAANAAGPAGGADLQEGTDYRPITPPQPTTSEAGQVEVTEVFMYSCPGCFAFEPHLASWEKRKPDYVNLVRLPASWNALAKVHAQAYYTAEVLGKLDEMHSDFFNEIHVKHNLLDSENALADFFGRYGVDEATFTKTFNSFAVHTKVQRADDLIRRYRIAATPSVVVNGKYLTEGSMAGSYEHWFEIIEGLAAKENPAR